MSLSPCYPSAARACTGSMRRARHVGSRQAEQHHGHGVAQRDTASNPVPHCRPFGQDQHHDQGPRSPPPGPGLVGHQGITCHLVHGPRTVGADGWVDLLHD